MLVQIGDTAVHAETIYSVSAVMGTPGNSASPQPIVVVEFLDHKTPIVLDTFTRLSDARECKYQITKEVNHTLKKY